VIQLLALLPHLLLLLLAAPVLAGLTGPGRVDQPWRDLRRLYRKPGLWPEHASLFGAVPAASLGASFLAAALVPSFTLGMATAPLADLVLIAFLLGLSRAALVLAGLDAQTGQGALAGQRLAALRLATEPGVLLLVLLVAVSAGSSNLDAASAVLREAGPSWSLILPGLAGAVLLLSAEAPACGLQDVFAGRDLAILQFASQLRRVTVLSVAAAVLLPFGLAPAGSGVEAWVVGAALWAVKVAALGAASSLLGGFAARLRADQAPELAALGLLLALIAAALFFAGQRAA
jgi:formate hydrogenlyase subunit 4